MWGAQSYLSPPNRCSHITSICGGPREVGSLGILHQESEHLFHCLGQASTATVGLLLDLDRQFCSCKSEQIKDGKLRSGRKVLYWWSCCPWHFPFWWYQHKPLPSLVFAHSSHSMPCSAHLCSSHSPSTDMGLLQRLLAMVSMTLPQLEDCV